MRLLYQAPRTCTPLYAMAMTGAEEHNAVGGGGVLGGKAGRAYSHCSLDPDYWGGGGGGGAVAPQPYRFHRL